MGAGFESRAQMIDRRLAREAIERRGFKKDIGAGAGQPLANVLRAIRRRGRRAIGEERGWIEAVRVGQPAQAPRGEAGEPPFDAEVAAKLRRFVDQQADEFPADVSVANESEIPGANDNPPTELGILPVQSV
jgi:hypothetical protein